MPTSFNGWISIHRKICDNEIWSDKPFSRGQAWIDLLLNTNYKDGCFWVRGNRVDVKRGQIGWSELTMGKKWGWSRTKVRRFLNDLETIHQIRQQKNNKTTIITVLNYNIYQTGDTPEKTAERPQKDRRRYTTNKGNKDNKDNNTPLPPKGGMGITKINARRL